MDIQSNNHKIVNTESMVSMTKRGICPKCRRFQLLITTDGKNNCSICGHKWESANNK